MTLAGRRVVITGGGSGVGADMAAAFAAAGAIVTICGRRPGPLQAVAARTGAAWVTADVTDEAQVEAIFAAGGPADIVIANAGDGASSPVTRMTLADWNAALAVNLTGTFLTFRAALRHGMGPGGRLVAVASVAGLRGYPYIAAYAAAKHGVVGLVRSIAAEVGPKGITANAICPGYLDTEMTARTIANIAAKTGRTEAAARAELERQSPQNRLFDPAEVTATALWLCSDGGRGINGQAIALAGGEP